MTITVIKGGSQLTSDEAAKIQAIFKESNNPNESIRRTFPGATFDGETIQLDGSGILYTKELEVES